MTLIVLKLFVDVFGNEEGMQEQIYTGETVESLLSCQASEFTDVRKRARVM